MAGKGGPLGLVGARCTIFIVMGETKPDNPEKHQQQRMILLPKDTPGVTVIRGLRTMGYLANESHCEVHFDDVLVPTTNLLGEESSGFAIAQVRLGPGRSQNAWQVSRVRDC